MDAKDGDLGFTRRMACEQIAPLGRRRTPEPGGLQVRMGCPWAQARQRLQVRSSSRSGGARCRHRGRSDRSPDLLVVAQRRPLSPLRRRHPGSSELPCRQQTRPQPLEVKGAGGRNVDGAPVFVGLVRMFVRSVRVRSG